MQYQGKRTAEIRVRVTDQEKNAAEAAAAEAGVPVSAWFRGRARLRELLAGPQCACAAHAA